MNRLDVETSKLQPMMAVVVGVIMVPIGLLSLASGVMRGFAPMPIVMGVLMLAMFGVLVAIVRRGGSKSVRYLTEEGMERGDGRWLPWTELDRVVQQVRVRPGTNSKAIWRTEIWFKNGESAWILPLRARNFPEVFQLVSTLPCEHVEKNV
jgi:hypothetical protein